MRKSGIEAQLEAELEVMYALLQELPELRRWAVLEGYGPSYEGADPADMAAGWGAMQRSALRKAEKELAAALRAVRAAHGVLWCATRG